MLSYRSRCREPSGTRLVRLGSPDLLRGEIMARRNLSDVIRYIRHLTQTEGGGAGDAELLERYVHCRDETAFELLMWRHGALVFNVCRRILPCEQDAEDAFQATFLAFVRKAGSISRRASVAGWLYKVAYRIALAAKERARKQAEREKPSGQDRAVQTIADPLCGEVRSILDEEVNRLPERLRLPIVLCYLEGKTNEEAARQLGCPPGTIFSRLARGREKLRKRLVRRGVSSTLAVLTAVLTEHATGAVPAAKLMNAIVQTALAYAAGPSAAGISPQVTALAEGVLRTMFIAKVKMTALLVLVVGLFAAGGMLTRHALIAAPQSEEAKLKPPVAEAPRDKEDKKPVVSVIRPTPGGLLRTSIYEGHVRASAQQVYPTVSGYLKRVVVDIGDRVKKGDILAAIDAPLLEVEVEQAKAALELEKIQVMKAEMEVRTAEADLEAIKDRVKAAESRLESDNKYLNYRKAQHERYSGLLAERAIDARLVDEQADRFQAARGAVNAAEAALIYARSEAVAQKSRVKSASMPVKMAQAKVKMAQFAVEKAQAQLDLTCLRANFDGVVTRRNFDVGDFISANEAGARRPLMTVMRTDSLCIVVDVGENAISFIHPGVSVQLHSKVFPDLKLADAKVSRTGFAVDESTRAMLVEIDVANPKNVLRPGMTIVATVQNDEKAPANAVTVPISCRVGPKGESVYVLRDGKAHLTPIEVSWTSDDKMEIASGIHASDLVVVDPGNLNGKVVPVEVKKSP